jgi:hypothetical protein
VRHRLAGAILLLYPRRVRDGHGPEIVTLIDDLIAQEGRSRARLFVRLAADGLVQRIASTATAWTAVAVLAATSFGGLAISEFAAANALPRRPQTAHTAIVPPPHTRQSPHRRHHTSHRSARMIARQHTSVRPSPR